MFRAQNKYLNCYFPSRRATSEAYVIGFYNLTVRNMKIIISFLVHQIFKPRIHARE